MKDNKSKKDRPKSRKCKLFNMSLKRRNNEAQLDYEPEIMSPHPHMSGLHYVGKTRAGNQSWKTADEIDKLATRKARYYQSNHEDHNLECAAKRREVSRKFDREADDLLTRYRDLGMDKSVFTKLDRPVQRRLKKAMPHIVVTSKEDREARMQVLLQKQAEQSAKSYAETVAAMEAKMERARARYNTLDVVETVTMEEIEAEHAKRKAITQDELNSMSSQRYEMPCLSEYASMRDELEEDGDMPY